MRSRSRYARKIRLKLTTRRAPKPEWMWWFA